MGKREAKPVHNWSHDDSIWNVVTIQEAENEADMLDPIQNEYLEHKVSELVHAVVCHAFCGATGRRNAEGLPQRAGNELMPSMWIVKIF